MTAEGMDPLRRVLGRVLEAPVAPGELEQVVPLLQRRRLEHLARLLHYRIAKLPDRAQAAACLALLDALSETAALRLLRAPALCEVLRLDGDGARLLALLQAEHDLDTGTHRDGWCALGAVWLGEGPPPGAPAVTYGHGRFRARALACGIPLDLSLPAAVENPGAGLRRPLVPDRETTLDGLDRLDRAVALLDEVVPAAHGLLRGLGGNIVLREDAARTSECWGASSGIAIGRIVVVNPAAAASTGMLAEALLHETVHAALDCAELGSPLLRLDAAGADATLPSPWSGNPLSPHAFLHACVVWAVLLDYWSGYRALRGEEEGAVARQAYIRRGFAAIDGRDALAPVAHCLADAAPDVVAIACACARAAA